LGRKTLKRPKGGEKKEGFASRRPKGAQKKTVGVQSLRRSRRKSRDIRGRLTKSSSESQKIAARQGGRMQEGGGRKGLQKNLRGGGGNSGVRSDAFSKAREFQLKICREKKVQVS